MTPHLKHHTYSFIPRVHNRPSQLHFISNPLDPIYCNPKTQPSLSIETHQTLTRLDPRGWIRPLSRGMLAKVLLLILAQLRIAPIRSLDAFHPLEKRRSGYVHLLHDSIFQIGTVELGHFHVAQGHIGPLEIGSVDSGIEEARSHEIGAPKVCVAHNALLERHALQILTLEVGPVEVNATRDRNRPSALQRGRSAGSDLAVRCDGRSGIISGGVRRVRHQERRGEQAHGEDCSRGRGGDRSIVGRWRRLASCPVQ